MLIETNFVATATPNPKDLKIMSIKDHGPFPGMPQEYIAINWKHKPRNRYFDDDERPQSSPDWIDEYGKHQEGEFVVFKGKLTATKVTQK